ncbi:MAG: anhydro-N-acetylmuramic acid kinase [Proteobacteria bacterium]|nr:anhydro-N-acetylmuramic acid kinase [Pseudomonadota bacterium]
MTETTCLGTISGTSVDGLDVALVRFDEACTPTEFVAGATLPLPAQLRDTLIDLGQRRADNIDHLGRADAALGEFIGESINAFLAQNSVAAQDVLAIGSHGQTVRHRPLAPNAFSLQIGDPNRIAEITGITTVADFRRRDIAAGGQGAPLVPPFHEILFRHEREARVVLNIGGISNITLLPPSGKGTISGYDTGPGNALMDAWIAEHKAQPFDVDAAWAASGQVHDLLLNGLMSDPYLNQPAPKSTGKEHYRLDWLTGQLSSFESIKPEDVQATLTLFTARSVLSAITTWSHHADRILVCGGGRLNPLLMQHLTDLANCPVQSVDEHGVDGDRIEAAAFAWLACRTLANLSGNAPSVTGATGPRILGAIYPA